MRGPGSSFEDVAFREGLTCRAQPFDALHSDGEVGRVIPHVALQAIKRHPCSTAGFSAPHRRNPPQARRLHTYGERNCSESPATELVTPGARLAVCTGSIDVFRIAVLSIVLALGVGPNASLLCAVWCHQEAAPIGACQHQAPTSSRSLTGTESCPDIAAATLALVREDVRRGGPASDGQHAVIVLAFQFVPPPNPTAFRREPGQHPPLEARPPVLALRI